MGFVGVFLCNMAGIMAHLSKIDQHRKPATKWYNLDWVNDGNHFTLFMLYSWTGLVLALGVSFYLGRARGGPDESGRALVGQVRAVESVGDVCDVWDIRNSLLFPDGDKKGSGQFRPVDGRLDYGLSVAAKLPVAFMGW